MWQILRVYLFFIAGGASVLFVVFSFPALTTSGPVSPTGVSQEVFEETLAAERAYCEQQPEALDCQCFTAVAGEVLSHQSVRVPRARYADPQDLARGQARDSC